MNRTQNPTKKTDSVRLPDLQNISLDLKSLTDKENVDLGKGCEFYIGMLGDLAYIRHKDLQDPLVWMRIEKDTIVSMAINYSKAIFNAATFGSKHPITQTVRTLFNISTQPTDTEK